MSLAAVNCLQNFSWQNAKEVKKFHKVVARCASTALAHFPIPRYVILLFFQSQIIQILATTKGHIVLYLIYHFQLGYASSIWAVME
jgi:hypothetical protein